MGFLEFLEWCEDLEIEPLLTVYAGYSLDTADIHPANTVPEEDLHIYIQEAIDQIQYATGSVDTPWGNLRAKHGHPEPFSIKYILLRRSGRTFVSNCISDSSRLETRIGSVIRTTGVFRDTWRLYKRLTLISHILRRRQQNPPSLTIILPVSFEASNSGQRFFILITTSVPAGSMWDLHHYETPQFFKNKFNFFDNWQEIAGYPGVTICK